MIYLLKNHNGEIQYILSHPEEGLAAAWDREGTIQNTFEFCYHANGDYLDHATNKGAEELKAAMKVIDKDALAILEREYGFTYEQFINVKL